MKNKKPRHKHKWINANRSGLKKLMYCCDPDCPKSFYQKVILKPYKG